MIYCVVPQALANELFDKLSDYYKDDPNVTVIVDRREKDRRKERDRRNERRDGEEPPEPASTHRPPMKFLKVRSATAIAAASLARGYSTGSVGGNVPVARARRRSRISRLPPKLPRVERRSGPSRRSTMTVTFGLSL